MKITKSSIIICKDKEIRHILEEISTYVTGGLGDLEREGVLTASNEHALIKDIVGDSWENYAREYRLDAPRKEILRKELQKEYRIRL